MPFDGVVALCVAEELKKLIAGGRIDKVFQPESDEIILNIWANGRNVKLLMSANAVNPRIHITSVQKENPQNPPPFCMLLRKHLSGGKITDIGFYDFERVIILFVESANELGDKEVKKLIVEVMGRHSNIILTDADGRIIDSIKHVTSEMSRVRKVMPSESYEFPPSQEKVSPAQLDVQAFIKEISGFKNTEGASHGSTSIWKYLLDRIKGFGILLCREICCRSGIDAEMPVADLQPYQLEKLENTLREFIDEITSCKFMPCIIYENEKKQKPLDFHCMKISQYPRSNIDSYDSICYVLDNFFASRDYSERLKHKKSGLLKLIATNIERCRKKMAIQEETLREASGSEKLRLYGELIMANIHSIRKGARSALLLNYYSEPEEYVEVELDENLLPQENAQEYFKHYAKAKSAYEYSSKQLNETLKELEYLESVQHMLDVAESIAEVEEIREELVGQGYLPIPKKKAQKNRQQALAPLRFISSDGLYIYAGKNNKQNDHLTLKTASANDTWLHARNIPGSHVIVKKQHGDIPDKTLLEAAIIAAYYSKARMSSNVSVDYTAVRNVKKPPGAKPGMVIYNNFRTINVTPDEGMVKSLLRANTERT